MGDSLVIIFSKTKRDEDAVFIYSPLPLSETIPIPPLTYDVAYTLESAVLSPN